MTNIQEFLDATAGQTTHEIRQANLAFCPYILGESLLLGMYLGLGHEVVAISLRVLYTIAEARGGPVTEYEIYRTFLTNTPPEKEAQFREIYSIHGRPALTRSSSLAQSQFSRAVLGRINRYLSTECQPQLICTNHDAVHWLFRSEIIPIGYGWRAAFVHSNNLRIATDASRCARSLPQSPA